MSATVPTAVHNETVYRMTQLLLQPTSRQQAGLVALINYTRDLYNAALEERRGAWAWEGRSVNRFDQQRQLTGWAQPFGVWPSRGALLRLDRSFRSFYRRVKAGETPGFPRFKSKTRWDSIEYPSEGNWKIIDDRLYLLGVGHVKFRTSRRGVRGTPKTLVVKREGKRWRAYVACEVDKPDPLPATNQAVGIDLGVTHLVATSDEMLVDNERFLRRNLDRLAEAQRVGDLHRKIARQRRDLAHKVSRQLVNDYDVIVHENLRIANMTRRPKPRPVGDGTYEPNGAAAKGGLNREILSAGWGQLLRFITYKAEEAGRELIAVDPKHTSQRCWSCGHTDASNRAETAFRCQSCGHTDHADINAARNILRAGLALRLEREAA